MDRCGMIDSCKMRSTIIESLVERLPADAIVTDVVVGIFWTFAQTQYGSAISATAHRWCEDTPGAIVPWAGDLTGMRVRDVAALYQSPSLPARSLANACISASFAPSAMTGIPMQGKAQALLESICQARAGRPRIALIGHFHFADGLRALGYPLDVYELDGRCEEGDIPSSRIPETLPLADIVVMTSSTIITHSTEAILSSCRADAYKMIVGPTVPLHPVLWEFGFDAVCGSTITDPVQVRMTAAQGGTHKQMTGADKINYLRHPLVA